MYKNEKTLPVSRIPCSGWPHTILSSVTSLSASSFLAYLADGASLDPPLSECKPVSRSSILTVYTSFSQGAME